MTAFLSARTYAPGLLVCGAVALGALVLERLEVRLAGHAWVEALVLAILAGTAVRTLWTPPARFACGIQWAAKGLLECAVALMGVTISFATIAAAGLPLLAGIVAIVFGAIAASFLLGRAFGLPPKMAVLVACGNAICGNSAIAAVAPVIDAESDDVATAIAFTAVLGVAVVIALPIVAHALHLSAAAGGTLAGLTVYAVPQVLAAAGPLGPSAVQTGTLVKLVRVLMLGPVVACLSVLKAHQAEEAEAAAVRTPGLRHGLLHFLPPFILVFLALAALRSLGLVPVAMIAPAHEASVFLTILAMAALGLGVDLRSVTAAGPRVVTVVTLSLLLLGLAALAVLRLTGLA